MSPMPSIWPTSRSGSNGSSLSSFSPLPTNLIGTPVTLRTDSAAPPRASPSSLVRITPSSSSALLKASAEATASWPGHRVANEKDLVRLDLLLDLSQLGHQLVVDVQPAGGVENQRVAAGAVGLDQGLLADRDRVRVGLAVDRDADLPADHLELLDGRRTLEVGRNQHRLAPLSASNRASLPQVVVLPAP